MHTARGVQVDSRALCKPSVTAMSDNKMQVQDSCHNLYDCAEHHNLVNTTLYSLQSIANATVSGRAH